MCLVVKENIRILNSFSSIVNAHIFHCLFQHTQYLAIETLEATSASERISVVQLLNEVLWANECPVCGQEGFTVQHQICRGAEENRFKSEVEN
jgi:hypothetical protein